MLVTLKYDIADLERVFKLDANGDGIVDKSEVTSRVTELFEYFGAHIRFRLDYLGIDLEQPEAGFEKDAVGDLLLVFKFRKTDMKNAGVLGITIDHFNEFGTLFRTIGAVQNGANIQQIVFTDVTPTTNIELREDGPGLIKQLWAFVLLGIEHIFLGIDHIMFLFGLLVLGGRFLGVVKVVSAFTISHSVTLVLAALQVLIVPGWIIESVIALSIIYVSIENFTIESIDKRWLVAGLFGFIHGFGFANVLGDLGLPSRHLISSLFSFNLGVEIGQLAIVAFFLPIIWLVLKTPYHRYFVWGSSALLFLFGATWFLERAK